MKKKKKFVQSRTFFKEYNIVLSWIFFFFTVMPVVLVCLSKSGQMHGVSAHGSFWNVVTDGEPRKKKVNIR